MMFYDQAQNKLFDFAGMVYMCTNVPLTLCATDSQYGGPKPSGQRHWWQFLGSW